MALSNRRYGRFTIPTGRYNERQGTSGDLRELVKAYQPRNFGAEPPISTLSRVAASLADPYTGEPVKAGRTVYENGTIGPNMASVVEEGAGPYHVTKIDMTGALVPPTGAGNKELNQKIYTFPAGAILVASIHLVAGVKSASTNASDSCKISIGSAGGTAASATLSGTDQDHLAYGSGVTANGTLINQHLQSSVGYGGMAMQSTFSRDVFFNTACNWTGADAAQHIVGKIWIHWTYLGNLT